MKKSIKTRSKKLTVTPDKELYESDFYKWTQTQSSLLKKLNFDKLDLENIIEELETLGRSDKHRLFNFLVVLLQHMLKNTYASEGKGNSNSWDATIVNCQNGISRVLKNSPSLKNYLLESLDEAYRDARDLAIVETQKTYIAEEDFPEECPWSSEELFPYLKSKRSK